MPDCTQGQKWSRNRRPGCGCYRILLSDAKLLNQVTVQINVFALEVVQKTPSLTDQLQQPAPGMMVFFMFLEMFGQIGDPGAQQGNLHLGRAGVFFVNGYPLDEFLFLGLRNHFLNIAYPSLVYKGML